MKSLPLSLSGVALGIALSAADYHVDWKTVMLLLMAVCFLHAYSVSGKSGRNKTMSYICLALTIAAGLGMLHFSFGTVFLMEPLILSVFGYMIIRAARHTDFVSRGKGILYVFLMFGLLAFYGSYYVCSHSFGSWPLLFPALSAGFLNVAARTEEEQKVFRIMMTASGWVAMTLFACLRMYDPWHFLFVLSIPIFLIPKCKVWAPLAFSLLTGLGFLVYLM